MRLLLALLLATATSLGSDLPRVLILGDSISIGYTKPVQEMLAKGARVSRPGTNCQYTAFGLEKIDAWLGETRWDVIHFNWGLHDLKFIAQPLPDSTIIRKRGAEVLKTPGAHQLASADEYAANLEKLVLRLKETGAALIFATTTPVPEGAIGRFQGDAAKYNTAALGVLKKHGVAINDLHAFATPRLTTIQQSRDVHFTKEGSALLGEEVVRSIREALVTRGKAPATAP